MLPLHRMLYYMSAEIVWLPRLFECFLVAECEYENRFANCSNTCERVDRGGGGGYGDKGERGTGVKGAGDRGKGGGGRGKRGRGTGRGGGGREILGAEVIPKFVVFYRFYSIFMYLNAITGYQEYLIDVLK